MSSLVRYAYYALVLLGLVIVVYRWAKLDRSLRWLLPLYIGVTGAEASYYFFGILYPYHIYSIVECVSLCMLYYSIFASRINKIMALTGLVVYVVFFVYHYFIVDTGNFWMYRAKDFFVQDIIIAVLSVLYLLDLYKHSEPVNFKTNPYFWITVANLFFYSGTAIEDGIVDYYYNRYPVLYEHVANISRYLNLLLYLLYIKALLCPMQKK
ncbi:MAG: hypothetical protein LBE82_09880 [Chitinophagaceae bacterium]|jgi:hypothetical protein|nr:hypothetical protein [Chitinophagaceae bacterium]